MGQVWSLLGWSSEPEPEVIPTKSAMVVDESEMTIPKKVTSEHASAASEGEEAVGFVEYIKSLGKIDHGGQWVEEVRLPTEQDRDMNRKAFVVHNVLTEEECEALIASTERVGFEQALVNSGGKDGGVVRTNYRNCDQIRVNSEALSELVWKRISAYIPSPFKGRNALGVNKRFSFLRYTPGHFFRSHYDGSDKGPGRGEITLLTLQIYLRSLPQGAGGGTLFPEDITGAGLFADEAHSGVHERVQPKAGSVLVFEHRLLHCGEEVKEGVKYSVRTSVRYSEVV